MQSSIGQKVLASSSWLALLRLLEKSIGLISTVILARLLSPEQFGIAALATLVLFFFEKFANTGASMYIIQKQDADEHDLNSAWSLDLLLKALLWTALVLGSGWIADFYEEPELRGAICFISLILLVRALSNPGMILLQKEINFQPIAKLGLYQKLISFVVTISLAFATRSYWALLFGQLASHLVFLLASYWIHTYRPRLTLNRVKQQWAFSQWVMLKGLLGFLKGQIDTILVSRLFALDLLGRYHMVRSVAALPGQDVIVPAVRPLLASFSKAKLSKRRLRYQLSTSLVVLAFVTCPISAFFWFQPHLVIDVLLGEQWSDTAPVLRALAPLVTSFVLGQVLMHCCIAMEKVKAVFFYDLFSLVCLVAVLLSLQQPSLAEFALTRSLLDLALVGGLFLFLSRITRLSAQKTMLKLLFPVAAAYLAGWTSMVIEIDLAWPLVELVIYGLVFGFSYLVAVSLCYWTYFRHTQEGQHIKTLLLQVLNKRRS